MLHAMLGIRFFLNSTQKFSARHFSSWNPNENVALNKSVDIYDSEIADRVASNLKLDNVKRHIFLCCDQSKAKCCSFNDGMEVWNHLNKRSKAHNDSVGNLPERFARTKANCLQVCKEGPIAVVYPDGIWYKKVNIETLDKIIDNHLINGVFVEENMIQNAGKTVQNCVKQSD